MKIAFNPSTVAALTTPPNNKDITFDLRGRNIFARGVEFKGTDTNTWRDIKINNVSIGSHTLDLRNGSNTTLTNTNGVVTINSTWRPVVDNLTSDSTTSSLSANQGRVLAGLINNKSDSNHNHDGRYVKRSGDTMLGALNFANGTWNLVGDDSYMGDCNVSGHVGIKAANTTYPGIAFFNKTGNYLGSLTAYSGNIKYGTYSLQFLDNGNTSVSASTWTNPFSTYNSNAVADGQAICVWGQSSYLGNLVNDTGDMSLWLKRGNAKVATLNMVLDGEYYANGNQRLAHASEIPTALKNPHALTLKANGTTLAIYDGSSAKEANFTYANVGAASASHTHSYYAVNENYGGFKKAERLPTSGFYQSEESESGGNAPWKGWMHLINCQHSNTNTNYALQIAASFFDNNTFKIRVTNGSVNNAWRDIIHSGNISSQSVASASKLQTARNIWGQSFDGTTNVDNTLRIRKTTGNYCEGIRIQTSDGAWSTIILGATSDSGTNANAWSIHRKPDNNFAISRNSSDGTNGLVMTSVGMGLGTTSPTQRLDVNGNIRTTGNLYISHATNNNMNHDTSNPRIVFSESSNQAVGLVYTDHDSYRASKGLKVMDVDNNDPGNVWFEVQGYNYSSGYVKNGSNNNYVLLGGGGHKLESALNVANATNAYHLRINSANTWSTWYWAGQGGQPNWLWGSNDGTNMYVWNPSNFRVAYAASAGNADTLDGEHASSFVRAGNFESSDLNKLDTYSFIKSAYSTNKDTSPKGNIGWYNVIQAVHRNGASDGPGYIGQIALGMTINTDDMFFRGKRTDPWKTVIHSGNIANQSVKYATNAGNSDKVDGYHATDGRTFTGTINWSDNWNDAWSDGTNKHPWYGFDHRYPNTGTYSTTISDFYGMTIKTAYNLRLDCANLLINGIIYINNVNAQIRREGSSQMWVNGRNGALLRETSVAGYHALWSLKTTNGSWDFGEYNAGSAWNNIPVLSYITDSNYNSGNNEPTYQIKFPLASGTVALTSDILNYYWANVKISTSSSTTTSPTVSNLTATNSIRMNNISLDHTNEINNITNDGSLNLNCRNSGNVSLCAGGGKVGIGTRYPSHELQVMGYTHTEGFGINPYYLSDSESLPTIRPGDGYTYRCLEIGRPTKISCIIADRTYLPGSTRGVLLNFKEGFDGQIILLKDLQNYGSGNGYFWVMPSGCNIIKADGSSILVGQNQISNTYDDGHSRFLVYSSKYRVWIEFLCANIN